MQKNSREITKRNAQSQAGASMIEAMLAVAFIAIALVPSVGQLKVALVKSSCQSAISVEGGGSETSASNAYGNHQDLNFSANSIGDLRTPLERCMANAGVSSTEGQTIIEKKDPPIKDPAPRVTE